MSKVEEGYKETKIGRIPADWEVRSLNEVLEVMTDYVANGSFQSLRENVNVYDEEEFAYYVRLYDLRLGIGHSSQKYVDQASYNFLNKSSLYENEILIANIGANVGEVFLMPRVNKPATIAPNMILMRVNDKNDFRYIYYYLSSMIGQREIANEISGSGQPKLNKTGLKKVFVSVPNLAEQRRIAGVLSLIDEVIQKTEDIIKQTEEVKKGLMQQLLTKGIGHTKFKKAEIGEIPEDWEVSHLSTYCQVNPTYRLDKGTLCDYVEMAAVNTDLPQVSYFDEREAGTGSGSRFKNGDVVFARITPCTENGKTALISSMNTEVGIGSTEFIVLSPIRNKMDSKFLYYLVKWDKIRSYAISKMVGTTGRQRVPKEVFKDELIVAFPTLNEQKRIGEILYNFDVKISKEKEKKEKLHVLKKGLMQSLLTGKVRVKFDEAEVTQV
ncbi:restriction endonuclease subunit S [Bacillus cereus group sp. MYBK226-2]|uniref:restriction endonuclease subunit S n=1 Tax=Bacillus cereus group sp. MYBK226-2 TaxID=3450655 RepID=UPI003F79ACCD